MSPLTLGLYVALLVSLGWKEDRCNGVSSGCALGPVVWQICWRFLERWRCFLRVLELARGFVVSQRRGAVSWFRWQSGETGRSDP